MGQQVPFTPRAKKALELTLREALSLGQRDLRAEHIVLGLLREGDGVAAQVLAQRGVTLAAARERVAGRDAA
jgi:ATP-dependent Clp protease ATP-binding subunit ClpC